MSGIQARPGSPYMQSSNWARYALMIVLGPRSMVSIHITGSSVPEYCQYTISTHHEKCRHHKYSRCHRQQRALYERMWLRVVEAPLVQLPFQSAFNTASALEPGWGWRTKTIVLTWTTHPLYQEWPHARYIASVPLYLHDNRHSYWQRNVRRWTIYIRSDNTPGSTSLFWRRPYGGPDTNVSANVKLEMPASRWRTERTCISSYHEIIV